MGYIADVAFVGRHGEDFSPGFHQCPGAGRRKVESVNTLRLYLHKTWSHLGKISRHPDVDRLALVGVEVVEMKRTELFDDDGVRPRRRGLEIKALALERF